jgi:hypothetical protein
MHAQVAKSSYARLCATGTHLPVDFRGMRNHAPRSAGRQLIQSSPTDTTTIQTLIIANTTAMVLASGMACAVKPRQLAKDKGSTRRSGKYRTLREGVRFVSGDCIQHARHEARHDCSERASRKRACRQVALVATNAANSHYISRVYTVAAVWTSKDSACHTQVNRTDARVSADGQPNRHDHMVHVRCS